MPRLDGTGPQGQGFLTGRGFGNCKGAVKAGLGRGMGRGMGCRGLGRGCYGRIAVGLSPAETKETLKQEKELLKQELEAVEKELKAKK